MAAHLGILPSIYEQYELGEAQVPATALADLVDLFKVPLEGVTIPHESSTVADCHTEHRWLKS